MVAEEVSGARLQMLAGGRAVAPAWTLISCQASTVGEGRQTAAVSPSRYMHVTQRCPSSRARVAKCNVAFVMASYITIQLHTDDEGGGCRLAGVVVREREIGRPPPCSTILRPIGAESRPIGVRRE